MDSALSRSAKIRSWLAWLRPPTLQSAVHFEIGDFSEDGSHKARLDFELFSLQQSLWCLGFYVCILCIGMIFYVAKAFRATDFLPTETQKSSCYLQDYRAVFGTAAQIGVTLPTIFLLRRWSRSSLQQLNAQASAAFLRRLRYIMLLPFLLSVIWCCLEDFNVRLLTSGGLDAVLKLTVDCSPGRTLPLDRVVDWSALMLQAVVFAFFALSILPADITGYIAVPLSLLALTLQGLAANEILDSIGYLSDEKATIFQEMGLWIVPFPVLAYLRGTQDRTALLMFEVLNHQHRATIHEKVLRCTAEHQAELAKINGQDRSCTQAATKSDLETSSKYQPSCNSCPAIVTDRCPLNEFRSDCGEQDCIPETSQVFVQKEMGMISVPLHDVKAGDQILCMDKLTQELHYIPVEMIERNPPPRKKIEGSMCRITLEDSSSLTMTSDHPVSVLGAMLPASDLQPGKHVLAALRWQQLAITSVEEISSEGISGVVAVHFNKGHRYDMLVAPHDSRSPLLHCMPVGAADAFPYKHGSPIRPAMMKRANSAPPSLFKTLPEVGTDSSRSWDSSSQNDLDLDDDDTVSIVVDQHGRQQGVVRLSKVSHSCKGGHGCRWHAGSGCKHSADDCKFCHHESHVRAVQELRRTRQANRPRRADRLAQAAKCRI